MIRSILFLLLLVTVLFSCKKNEPGQQQQQNGANLQCNVVTSEQGRFGYDQYVYDIQGRLSAVQANGSTYMSFRYNNDSVFLTYDSLELVKVLNAEGLPTYINNGRTVLEFSYTTNGELDRVEFFNTNNLNVPNTIITDVQYTNGDLVSFNVLGYDMVTNVYDTTFSTFLTYNTSATYYEYFPEMLVNEFNLLEEDALGGFAILYNPQVFSEHLISTCQQFGNRLIEFDYGINSNGRVESLVVNDNYGILSNEVINITYDCQ